MNPEMAWLRTFEPMSFVLLLARVQLIVAIVLIAALLDLLMGGSMREALRYALMDAPRQFVFAGAALLVVCGTLRFTLDAMFELVAPDLLDTPGAAGHLAHVLPRFCALAVALAASVPLMLLALDAHALATHDQRLLAAGVGAAFIATGAVAAFAFRGPLVSRGAGSARAPSMLVKTSIAIVPLAIAIVFCGTVLGVWKDHTGMAENVVARYEDASWLRLLAEAFALFAACLSARLAIAVVFDLVAPDFAERDERSSIFHRWLPRATAFLVAMVLAAEVVGRNSAAARSGTDHLWLWSTVVGYVLVGIAAALIGARRMNPNHAPHGYPTFGRRWSKAAERIAGLNRAWRYFFGVTVIAAIAVFIVFYDTTHVQTMQMVGPISILLLWGFAATVFFFPLAYLSHMVRVPLLLMFVLAGIAFAGFDLNDNHELRRVVPVATAHPLATDYGEDLDLANWIASRRDWNAYEHYPIFLVATEGGGIRAAYFTASILSALQERCPGFAQHLLAISSVSGGSVGAAVFASLAADHAQNAVASCNLAGRGPGDFVGRARKVLATDLLSPLVGAALFPDALQRVLPVPIDKFDRSRALEYALEDSWRDANQGCKSCDPERLAEEVADLYRQSTPRRPVPHLFLNTTEAGTGRSIPYATAYVKSLATPYFAQAEIDDTSPTAGTGRANIRLVTLQDRLDNDHVPLSTAAMLSARFPYLTPAGRIADVGHYVDGGYFENSGTWLISGLVQNLVGQKIAYRNPANPALEQAVRNAVFITIVVRSSPCTRDTEYARCEEDGSRIDEDSTWNEMLSPLRALLNTRDKRAEYSTRDLSALTALIEQFSAASDTQASDNRVGCHHTLCAVSLRFRNAPNVEVPLTWLLSSRARAAMDDAVDRMERANIKDPASLDPARQRAQSGNHILGSYGRIICILSTQKGSPGCNEPAGMKQSDLSGTQAPATGRR